MGVIETILIIIEALASIALIAVVLLQTGKNSGLGAIGGNNDNFMTKGKTSSFDKLLANATKWIAIVWIVLTLVLSLV